MGWMCAEAEQAFLTHPPPILPLCYSGLEQ